MDGRRLPNGKLPRNNRVHPQPGQTGGLRIPTAHEALAYSPFSSILPFPPTLIPAPVSRPAVPSSTFQKLQEVQQAQRTLEQLSAGARNAELASKRCQQTLRDVQKLLDPGSITRFKFRLPERLTEGAKKGQPTQRNGLPTPNLSPYAKMVLDTSKVSYRYLTPESPESREKPAANGVGHAKPAAPSPQGQAPPAQQLPIKMQQVVQQTPNRFLTPQPAPPTGSHRRTLQAVIVPQSLTPAQLAERQYIPEDSTGSAPHATPTRMPDSRLANGYRQVSVDQRQGGDQAVQTLESFLSEIFTAEDLLQPGTSGVSAVNTNGYFELRDFEGSSQLALLPETQWRLESHVQQVVANGRLEDVAIDSWAHVQRLCGTAVSETENTSLRIGEDWSEQDNYEWTQRLMRAERGIVAGRTLMCIMGAGAHIKELQSEDFLRAILAALCTVLETCIVPIVQLRYAAHVKVRGSKEEPASDPSFILASTNNKMLRDLLSATARTFRALGDFLAKTEVDETALSSIESMCQLLIFAENAANDRDSVLGVQRFEDTRRGAMDVLAKVFAKYPDQRQSIVREVLMSLEKLPPTKQIARQYRLQDAKPIQLVSALLMRFVQTSATHGGEIICEKSKAKVGEQSDGDEEDDEEVEEDLDEDYDKDVVKVASEKAPGQSGDLLSIAKPLHDAAQSNAFYIVRSLVQRALSSSKSSDEPYRKLLDLFTEDFLNVLGSSDWPAAEMLLRTLVKHMIDMVRAPKSAGAARILALELLGTIGSGIIELQILARNAVCSLDGAEAGVGQLLKGLVEQSETGDVELSSVTASLGPYRVVVEYLQARGLDEAQHRSAYGFYLMQWAFLLSGGREGSTDSDPNSTPRPSQALQNNLRNMIVGARWLETNHDHVAPSAQHGRLAAIVVILTSKLCKAFTNVFSVLLESMSSDQPKVKSRAIKSVEMLLEKDPSILDRNVCVLKQILRCAQDASPLVRDSALSLIADCIKLRPALDKSVYDRVIERSGDASTAVRKRAVKMLRDLYLGNESVEMRSGIADAIIARMEDVEESIVELARTTMEEVWFTPLIRLKITGDNAVQNKLQFGAQADLLIRTVAASEKTAKVLESLIKQLTQQSKTASAHITVCTTVVQVLSDGIVDSTDLTGAPTQSAILRCLAVFAQASPRLFTAAQLERLEPYARNLTSKDDLEVYRSAITILRFVIPHQHTLKLDFLLKLQTALLTSITKLSKSELVEVVPCLWTVTGMLRNPERLIRLVVSALNNVHTLRSADLAAQQLQAVKCSRSMVIVGHFGKFCDFDDYLVTFKGHFTWFKGNSVCGLLTDVLIPFTSPRQPAPVRQAALEATGMICTASPRVLLRTDVVNVFETVFEEKDPILEEVLLYGLEGIFSAGEISSGSEAVSELGAGVASGHQRLGKTYVATDQDGASTSIARRFLPQIVHIALSSRDERAIIAAKIIVSVNRQGLAHPKESGPALVALETCPDSTVANMAFAEHSVQHSKHESLFDKEYMRAIQQAYAYQRDIIGSPAGFTGETPVPKLHLLWEVLKTGKAVVRKKFLANLVQKLDFGLGTEDATGVNAQQLSFVRFCVENLAFFEYDKVEELIQLLTALEKMFSGTGTTVAQAIESEVLKLRVDADSSDAMVNDTTQTMAAGPIPPQSISPRRLNQLAIAAQICSLVWETRSFIRRLWNMQKHANKPRSAVKETRNANRATNAPALGGAYLSRVNEIMASSGSGEDELAACKSFVELISVDTDVKVGSDAGDEEETNLENGYRTPSEGPSEKSESVPPSGGRDRKRKSLSANATPRKKGRPSLGKRLSGSRKHSEHVDEDGGWE